MIEVGAAPDKKRQPAEPSLVSVYTPESELCSPGRLLRAMVRDLLASRELAWRLMVRDISARYRRSVLGVLWPLLTSLASAAVFVGLQRGGVLDVGATAVPYPAFVVIGTVFWSLFVASLNAPLAAVAGGASMLAKINFPREALILAAVGKVFFDFSISCVVLAVVFVVYGIPVTGGLLLAPFALLMLSLLGFVLGLLIMPLGVLYNDVSAALNAVTGVLFLLTPVVYPPERAPFPWLVTLNPASPLLVGARELATGATLSDPLPFALVSAVSVVGLLAVWVLYRVSLPILIERMHA